MAVGARVRFSLIAVAVLISLALGCVQEQKRLDEQRISQLRLGFDERAVRSILGEPTEIEKAPFDGNVIPPLGCAPRARSVLIYVSSDPRQDSLLAFFDDRSHLVCTHRLMLIHVKYR